MGKVHPPTAVIETVIARFGFAGLHSLEHWVKDSRPGQGHTAFPEGSSQPQVHISMPRYTVWSHIHFTHLDTRNTMTSTQLTASSKVYAPGTTPVPDPDWILDLFESRARGHYKHEIPFGVRVVNGKVKGEKCVNCRKKDRACPGELSWCCRIGLPGKILQLYVPPCGGCICYH